MSYMLSRYVGKGEQNWVGIYKGTRKEYDVTTGKIIHKALFSNIRNPEGEVMAYNHMIVIDDVMKEISKLSYGSPVKFTAFVLKQRTVSKRNYILEGIKNLIPFDSGLIVSDDIKETVYNLRIAEYTVRSIAKLLDSNTDFIFRVIRENEELRKQLSKKQQYLYNIANGLRAKGMTEIEIAKIMAISASSVRTYLPIRKIPEIKTFLAVA